MPADCAVYLHLLYCLAADSLNELCKTGNGQNTVTILNAICIVAISGTLLELYSRYKNLNWLFKV